MAIAVIGWGSLLWRPRGLNLATRRWHKDGPVIPLEFARRSSNGTRLTLAAGSHFGVPVKAYWALSGAPSLEDARENLKDREGTDSIGNIFAVDRDGRYWGRNRDDAVRWAITNWLACTDMKAAVWTGLKANWPTDIEFSFETVDAYIKKQRLIDRAGIQNYVRRAPNQIDTRIRDELEDQYTWTSIPLPGSCFEDQIAEV